MNEKPAPRFVAVDIHELRARLGSQCSPDPGRTGYVIGPDVTGCLCHVASCRDINAARAYADKMNGKPE